MPKSKCSLVPVVALLLGAASFGQTTQPSPREREAALIAVLKSDAAQKEKADACRELARVGTKDCVPVLAGLLGDEKLSHMARYGMETIPDPAVDDALRDALGKLKGRPLVGVIGSIGVRRDAQAASALAKFLSDADADVAQAAARALGKIGTAPAAKALTDALASVPAGNQVAFCEGLFRCAEAMAAAGQREEALAIYERLRALPEAPQQIRAGALRGAVLIPNKMSLPLLVEAIRGSDWVLVAAAVRASQEMPGAEVTQLLAAELPKATGDKQILLIQTLGNRGDAAAVPAVLAAAKSGPANVRVAAVRSLTQLGSASVVPALVELTTGADAEVASAAQVSLASFPGTDADAAIMGLLTSQDANTRCVAAKLVGQRRMGGAIPKLLKAAEDADDSVRAASLKVLGDLGGGPELPALIALLMKAKTAQETQAAEGALSAICVRQTNPEAAADALCAALAQAPVKPKLSLLRALRSVGGAKALAAVRTAATDANPEIKDAALRALCGWPTVDAFPDVVNLAKTSTDAKLKILAVGGYIRLVRLQELPPDKKLAALKDAMALIERNDERKLALAALGDIPTADALALVTPHLGTAGLKEEASAAAVAIAEKIIQTHPAEVAAAMQQVSTATTNDKLLKRAKNLLSQAKRTAPRK